MPATKEVMECLAKAAKVLSAEDGPEVIAVLTLTVSADGSCGAGWAVSTGQPLAGIALAGALAVAVADFSEGLREGSPLPEPIAAAIDRITPRIASSVRDMSDDDADPVTVN